MNPPVSAEVVVGSGLILSARRGPPDGARCSLRRPLQPTRRGLNGQRGGSGGTADRSSESLQHRRDPVMPARTDVVDRVTAPPTFFHRTT